MFERIIENATDLTRAINEITRLDLTHPKILKWGDYSDKRGLTANALSHVWYTAIAIETGEIEIDIKSECKLDFGVPILLGEDVEFAEFFEATGINRMDRESQLKAMKLVPVTSRMKKTQMCRYLNAMQQSYVLNLGIILEAKGEYKKWVEKNGYGGLENSF